MKPVSVFAFLHLTNIRSPNRSFLRSSAWLLVGIITVDYNKNGCAPSVKLLFANGQKSVNLHSAGEA